MLFEFILAAVYLDLIIADKSIKNKNEDFTQYLTNYIAYIPIASNYPKFTLNLLTGYKTETSKLFQQIKSVQTIIETLLKEIDYPNLKFQNLGKCEESTSDPYSRPRSLSGPNLTTKTTLNKDDANTQVTHENNKTKPIQKTFGSFFSKKPSNNDLKIQSQVQQTTAPYDQASAVPFSYNLFIAQITSQAKNKFPATKTASSKNSDLLSIIPRARTSHFFLSCENILQNELYTKINVLFENIELVNFYIERITKVRKYYFGIINERNKEFKKIKGFYDKLMGKIKKNKDKIKSDLNSNFRGN